MNTIDLILAQYDAELSNYELLARTIRIVLEAELEEEDIQVHSIDFRVKGRESLSRKLNRPTVAYQDLRDLTDIAGVRIITYYSSDVDQIADIVRREFSIDAENSSDKRALLDPDRFGYLSLHFVASLGASHARLAEAPSIADLKAEIQIRSILQHAWAEIEHDLGYKSKHAIPMPIRRRFSRLSGLLELADQEFDGLRSSLGAYAEEIANREDIEQSIDRISLAHFIQRNPLVQELDEEIRDQTELELVFEEWFVETLVDRLRFVGITELSDLESNLQRLSAFTSRLAVDHIRERSYSRIHRGVSIYYFCTTLLAESEDKERLQAYLASFGLGKSEHRQELARDIIGRYESASQTSQPPV